MRKTFDDKTGIVFKPTSFSSGKNINNIVRRWVWQPWADNEVAAAVKYVLDKHHNKVRTSEGASGLLHNLMEWVNADSDMRNAMLGLWELEDAPL